MSRFEWVRRLITIGCIAFWVGGFFFYAGVVVPTGSRVLESDREQGFITQQVTGWLNLSSIPVLAIFFVDVLIQRRVQSTFARRTHLATWIGMVLAQVVLFVVHASLDGHLDSTAHRVLSRAQFYPTHRVYVIVATLQQLFAIGYIGLTVIGWHRLSSGTLSADVLLKTAADPGSNQKFQTT